MGLEEDFSCSWKIDSVKNNLFMLSYKLMFHSLNLFKFKL